jgi:hypothetical protein
MLKQSRDTINYNNTLYQSAKEALCSIDNFESVESKENIKKFLKKICVSQPYFVFSNIVEKDEFLIAKTSPHQIMGNERSVITVGEAGRHAAILGSCSCSRDFNERKYYLFQNGDIINKINDFVSDYQDVYIVTTKISEYRRTFIAKGFVFDCNFNLIYDVDMSYTTLTLDLFKRFFGKYFCENYAKSYNPYIKYLDNIEEVLSEPGFILYDLKKTKLADCVGHFDQCPAIPTAYLMHNIIHLCCNRVIKLFNLESYIVTNIKLNLKELMFAVNEYKIDVKYNCKSQNKINFIIEIKDDDKIINFSEFNIKAK